MNVSPGKQGFMEQELEPLSASGKQAVANVISAYVEDAEAEADTKWRGGRNFTYGTP